MTHPFSSHSSLSDDDRNSMSREQLDLYKETYKAAKEIADELEGWDENWASTKKPVLEHKDVNRLQELINKNGAEYIPQRVMVGLAETLTQYYQSKKFFAHSFHWARTACQLLANKRYPRRDPILFARTRYILGETLLHQGYLDESLPFFEQTLDTICNDIVQPLLPTSIIELLCTCIDRVANAFLLLGDIPKATALTACGIKTVVKRLKYCRGDLNESGQLPYPELCEHIQALCGIYRNQLGTRADIYLVEKDSNPRIARYIFENLQQLVNDDLKSNALEASEDDTLQRLRTYVLRHGVIRAVIALKDEGAMKTELTKMGDVDSLPWSETKAVAYVDCAALHHALGNPEKAKKYYKKAERLWNDIRPHETANPFFSSNDPREQFANDCVYFHRRIPTKVSSLSIPYAYKTDIRNKGYEQNFNSISNYWGCEHIDSDEDQEWSERIEKLKNLEIVNESSGGFSFPASYLPRGGI